MPLRLKQVILALLGITAGISGTLIFDKVSTFTQAITFQKTIAVTRSVTAQSASITNGISSASSTTGNASSTSLSVTAKNADDTVTGIFFATTTVNPNSIGAGQTTTSAMTITGAKVGDLLSLTCNNCYGTTSTVDIMDSYISAANTVTLNIRDATSTAQDYGEMFIIGRVESHQ